MAWREQSQVLVGQTFLSAGSRNFPVPCRATGKSPAPAGWKTCHTLPTPSQLRSSGLSRTCILIFSFLAWLPARPEDGASRPPPKFGEHARLGRCLTRFRGSHFRPASDSWLGHNFPPPGIPRRRGKPRPRRARFPFHFGVRAAPPKLPAPARGNIPGPKDTPWTDAILSRVKRANAAATHRFLRPPDLCPCGSFPRRQLRHFREEP